MRKIDLKIKDRNTHVFELKKHMYMLNQARFIWKNLQFREEIGIYQEQSWF